MATAKKHTPKKEAPKAEVAPNAPVEVIVPPVEAVVEPSVEAPKELMQTAGGNETVDPRPLAVIADDIKKKLPSPGGKTLFVAKSKDQAIPILANGREYRPHQIEGVWVWEVADEDAPLFAMHSHVLHGRIVQAAGK